MLAASIDCLRVVLHDADQWEERFACNTSLKIAVTWRKSRELLTGAAGRISVP
jgi:hypothetical protein